MHCPHFMLLDFLKFYSISNFTFFCFAIRCTWLTSSRNQTPTVPHGWLRMKTWSPAEYMTKVDLSISSSSYRDHIWLRIKYFGIMTLGWTLRKWTAKGIKGSTPQLWGSASLQKKLSSWWANSQHFNYLAKHCWILWKAKRSAQMEKICIHIFNPSILEAISVQCWHE